MKAAPSTSTRRQVRVHAYDQLAAEFADWIARIQGQSLIVAPARGVADDLLRRHLTKGVIGVHRFTLNQLAAVIAAPQIAISGRKPANRLSTEALSARVVHLVRTGPKFSYFEPVAKSPGFTRALARTLLELRLNRISSQQLESISPSSADLAVCLDFYSSELQRSGLADIADMYLSAIEILRAGGHRFNGIPVLFYDLALDTRLAHELVDALAASSPDVLDCTLAAEAEENNNAARTTIERVRQYLFSPQVAEAGGLDPTVDYFSAPGEAMESVEIARRIYALARSDVSFDRIAILLRHPERYQPLIEEALRRAEVPAYFSRGVVRPDPAGRAFLALLACALEECSASRFAEYLSLGQVPRQAAPKQNSAPPSDEILRAFTSADRPPEPKEQHDTTHDKIPVSDGDRIIAGTLQAPVGWEELLIDASVIGGVHRWERRLRGLENELLARAAELADEPDRLRAAQFQIERLRHLESFALPLIAQLHALPQSAVWADYIDLLGDLARSALSRPDSVLEVLAELAPMAEVGPVQLVEVFHVLSERLRQLRSDPPDRRYGRVFVGSIVEARGRFFDAVFLPGLAEGMFPAKVAEDPLLLDVYRSAISPDLPTNRRRREQERLLLRVALAAGSRIIFSYPRIDLAQSRPRVPSFYALEIIRSAHGYLPELQEFQTAAAAAAPTRLDRPAPREFADAIDDTEYDLVALDKVNAGGSDREGAMNYLLDANTTLARSLRARYQRWSTRKWTSADGLLEKNTLPAYGLTERPYSPTALQQFAACPYRFALHAVFGLRARETAAPLYQMDALTRGALFHDVQRDLFRTLQADGLLPVEPHNLGKIRSIADEVLDDVAALYADKLAPAIPRVWRSEVEDIRSDLHGWLPYLAAERDWIPSHYELAFGLRDLTGRDPSSTHEPVSILNGIRVAGSIDLVERHRSRNAFRIIDHKTGRSPERKQMIVGGGSSLQPLIYALAASEILGAETESGALFFCTQRGNFESMAVNAVESNVKWLRRAFEIVDNAIAKGELRAAPARDACGLCDYRCVCGPYEEQRLRKKSRDGLEELDELRSMP